ncbi:response regulator [Pseudohoeflea suaedae]|uniref:Response regulator n=1 Tax=Pseudohoeflea suaedae TaxID=877384 RepID=A0A4R5PNM1_9HYPH|nr:response regulator [Pseudohoeflea suaedae]TDH38498.1 response regulator [Pseudohoeflea suaedae]
MIAYVMCVFHAGDLERSNLKTQSECGKLSAGDISKDNMQLALVEGLAGSLGTSVAIYDRDDTLIYSSKNFNRFFDIPDDSLVIGTRLRDFLGAIYDCGARFGVAGKKRGAVSRNDWIAERIAIHWRERYDHVEQLPHGRWVRLGQRRLPGGLLITHITDISDQMRRSNELKAAEDGERLAKDVVDNLPNPILVKDETLQVVLVNKAFCSLLGYKEHEILGRRVAEVVGEEAASVFEERERRVMETGEPLEFVEDIPHADGSLIRSITRQNRVRTSNGCYIVISIDRITTQSGLYHAGRKTVSSRPEQAERTRKRILIVDQDRARAEEHAAALRSETVETLAIGDLHQLFSFLDTARSMDVSVDVIEVSDEIGAALAANPAATEYPVLTRLLAERVSRDIARRTAEAEAQRSAEVEAERPTDVRHVEAETSDSVPEQREEAARQMPPVAENQQLPDDPAVDDEASDAIVATDGGEAETAVQPVVAPPEPAPVRIPVPPAAPRALKTSTVRILVAEDNDVNQIVFEQILTSIGVDYHIVSNGQEAVEAWEEMKPDLILMDVSMPVMNGHEASRRIREEENARSSDHHVPILAVTAHAMAGDADACYAAGMDDYLTKPVSPEKLEAAINLWVPTRHGQQVA